MKITGAQSGKGLLYRIGHLGFHAGQVSVQLPYPSLDQCPMTTYEIFPGTDVTMG